MEFTLPGWMEGNLIDSGPGAYDALEPELRARLKTQIALLYDYWGEKREDMARRSSWLDRTLCDEEKPVEWSLFLFDPVYASAPGLLAALMPAILAKSPEIIACRIGGPEFAARRQAAFDDEPEGRNRFGALPLPVSAAFELAGLEQIWDLDTREAVRLLADLDLQGGPGSGRVVILGSATQRQAASWMSEIIWPALQKNVPCMSLPGQVKIAVDQTCGADFELLRWAHPQADIYSVERAAGMEFCHAFVTGNLTDFYHEAAAVCGKDKASASGAKEAVLPPLCLQPGNEAFWVWPDLPPAFFRKRRLGIFNRSK